MSVSGVDGRRKARCEQFSTWRRLPCTDLLRITISGGAMNQDRLVAFSDMKNFKVSDEDPDVRGWTVVDGEGHSHGTVRDMLIDRDRLKVEYFTVEGDGNQTGVVDAGS